MRSIIVILICFNSVDFNFCTWIRVRKRQAGVEQQISNLTWPGQDNKFPYVSQWGAWTQMQLQQGIGQRSFQPWGIQINPSQAQWYPNSPEYTGFRAELGVKPVYNNNTATAPAVLYWPPTTLPPVHSNFTSWGTWASIEEQGRSGGLMPQWQNWYQNPDVWAQWNEWMSEKQRQRGKLPGGQPAPPMNQTFIDDTGQILVNILAGFVAGTALRKVAMYNMKTYYPQYRRNYWIGGRFYHLDPDSQLTSYLTCSYELPSDIQIQYEIDDTRVNEIVFHCVKYQETCCKLNCCDSKGRPLYYASFFGAADRVRQNFFVHFAVFYVFMFALLPVVIQL